MCKIVSVNDPIFESNHAFFLTFPVQRVIRRLVVHNGCIIYARARARFEFRKTKAHTLDACPVFARAFDRFSRRGHVLAATARLIEPGRNVGYLDRWHSGFITLWGFFIGLKVFLKNSTAAKKPVLPETARLEFSFCIWDGLSSDASHCV